MTGLLFSIQPGALRLSEPVAARLLSLAEEGALSFVVSQRTPFEGAKPVALPEFRCRVPGGTTAAWRAACLPMADAVDALDAVEVIFVSDLLSLRVLTAARVPLKPIVWLGEAAALEKNPPSCAEACALRLTTVLWFFDDVSESRIRELCGWQQAPREMLPAIPSAAESGFERLQQLLAHPNPLLPAQMELALRSGALPFLGQGSRRVCHQLGGTGLCVKCYHRPEKIPAGQASAEKVRREILASAHSRRTNTSCQEYDYLQKLLRDKPQEILALFPEVVEIIYLPFYGWSLAETLIANADGSPAQHFAVYLRERKADRTLVSGVLEQLDALVEQLIASAVTFYDLHNILVQETASGAIRFRVADFEPRNRQAISFFMKAPFFIRQKIRRRYARTLKNTGMLALR